jgi:lipopolysaccharide transport system permease protein
MKNNKREEISHYFELLLEMTRKELIARYKYTILGFFWLIANPLLQMLVIGTIFTFFLKEPIENYFFYLFIGLLVWNFFSLSLTKATSSIVNERSLIKKAKFPRSVIPLSIIVSNAVYFLISLTFLIFPLLFLHTLTFLSFPYVLIACIQIFVFTMGLSLLTSALNVRYRDVNFVIQALLIVWFYATPIIYSFNLIPQKLIWIWRLNPLTSTIQFFQHALLNYSPPGPAMIVSNIVVILLVTILGIRTFRAESKNFDDWV